MHQVASRGYMLPSQEYPKDTVIERLKANRTKHVADYNEAFLTYKEEAVRLLTEIRAGFAKKLGDAIEAVQVMTEPPTRRLLEDPTFPLTRLVPPANYTSVYDQAIEQLTLMVKDTIVLDDAAYKCLMLDQWEWTHQFRETVEKYSNIKTAVSSSRR